MIDNEQKATNLRVLMKSKVNYEIEHYDAYKKYTSLPNIY